MSERAHIKLPAVFSAPDFHNLAVNLTLVEKHGWELQDFNLTICQRWIIDIIASVVVMQSKRNVPRIAK